MVAMATPTPPTPHAPTEFVNIGGAPAATSIVALTIAPPLAFVAAAAITKAALATAECGHSYYT
jgi:hypothetical protein